MTNFQLILYVCTAIILLSVNLNFYLFLKLRKSAKTPQLTTDAQELLHDITGGSAILKINVIDPGDILLRSPRG